jgi:hypothetical protein
MKAMRRRYCFVAVKEKLAALLLMRIVAIIITITIKKNEEVGHRHHPRPGDGVE